MYFLRKTCLLLLALLLTITVNGMGLADWQEQTPGKNTIGDAGSGMVLTMEKTGHSEGVDLFYFYKGYIIGNNHSTYFVANEATGVVRTFDDPQQWKDHINRVGLSPHAWTRWYADNWEFYELFPFFIFMPASGIIRALLILATMVLTRYIAFGKRSPFKKKHLIIFSAITFLLLLRVFLDAHPQSI